MKQQRLIRQKFYAVNSFIVGLDKSVDEIMIKEKVGMKKAKGLIYDFILAHNFDTK